MKVKIYGLIRSGTNYLEKLIENHGIEVLFDGKTLDKPWKHGVPIKCADVDKHICIVKDPYAWKVSERCHSEDITEIIQTIRDWNFLVGEYKKKEASDPSNWCVIKYFDLILGDFSKLESFLGIELKEKTVSQKMLYSRNLSSFKFKADFYLNGEYLNFLTKGDLNDLKGIEHEEFIENPLPENHKPALTLAAAATGHGDAIMAAQLAFSLEKSLDRKVILYTVKHKTASLWLGNASRPLTKAEPDSILINGWFTGEKSHLGKQTFDKARLDLYKQQLPPELQNFDFVIPELDTTLPETEKYDVCLFPFSTDPARTYPRKHWLKIYEELSKDFNVVIVGKADVDYKDWGNCKIERCSDIYYPIGLIQNAKLTIGNDSGPVHFAGMLKKPALALLGIYSGETLYHGIPSVSWITHKSECSYCFNLAEKGYTHLRCNSKCDVLFDLDPLKVAEAAKKILYDNRLQIQGCELT